MACVPCLPPGHVLQARLDAMDAGTRRVDFDWHIWDKQLPLDQPLT